MRQFFAPDGGVAGTGGVSATQTTTADVQGQAGTPPSGGTPQTWAEYLATLPDTARGLYEGEVQGLRNSVQATRGERDALRDRLDEIGKALGKDKITPQEAQATIAGMREELEQGQRRLAFLEEATQATVKCSNPRLAWLVAQQEKLFTSRGAPDWAAIRAAAPELFAPAQAPTGNANGGAGTQQPAPGSETSLNQMIRRAAGKG